MPQLRGRGRNHRLANLHANWRRYHEKRQRNLCALCGKPMGDDVTLDHIMPVTKGGEDSFENTQAAHEVCNWMKGNVPPKEGA
jgi:Restriction endonuclease